MRVPCVLYHEKGSAPFLRRPTRVKLLLRGPKKRIGAHLSYFMPHQEGRRGGVRGVLDIVHGRMRMSIDPRIP